MKIGRKKGSCFMARVKGAVVTRRRRKKILKMAKGYFGGEYDCPLCLEGEAAESIDLR